MGVVRIQAADAATTEKTVTAWAKQVQERLKRAHAARFEVEWTHAWTAENAYAQSLKLNEGGRPYATIELLTGAARSWTLAGQVLSPPAAAARPSKLRNALAAMAALAALAVWAYVAFFDGGLGRAWSRLANFGPCAGCASKLEVFYTFLAGWSLVPIAVAIPFLVGGTSRPATGPGPSELGPWLAQTLETIQAEARVDSRMAEELGLLRS